MHNLPRKLRDSMEEANLLNSVFLFYFLILLLSTSLLYFVFNCFLFNFSYLFGLWIPALQSWTIQLITDILSKWIRDPNFNYFSHRFLRKNVTSIHDQKYYFYISMNSIKTVNNNVLLKYIFVILDKKRTSSVLVFHLSPGFLWANKWNRF